ncbi:MAG: ammonium transporter [Coriobacteriales bacterium]|jgi:Amt family ammonium transporter|nr:ammonium transporter [Coriobacteriales bacterium]
MLDTGTSAFMLVCVMLVLLMTPGLAFFYGGLARRKNVVNTMFMSMVVLGIVGVAWVLVGQSFAYGGDGALPFFGGFDQIGLLGGVSDMLAEAEGTENSWPDLGAIAYQAAFAMITTAIVTGSVAGRMKFGAVVAFVVIWVPFIYAPLAHMVWGGEGSLVGDMIGAIDFAGGDVVHISSGVAGLVLCLILGRRKGYGLMSYRPHNVPFVVLGATLLWFGWFGFNGGSAFAADGVAALAMLNTLAASAAALLSWSVIERIRTGKPTLVGAATGLVAGLVVITPAAGFVEPWAAVVMGLVVSPVCYFSISYLKHRIGYDDALDAFGCHAVGGVTGGVLTGLFCVPQLQWTSAAMPEPVGGLLYSGGDPSLFFAQILGILVSIAFVACAVAVVGFALKLVFKGSLRVDTSEENEGLDTVAHGESAYPAFNGLD